MRMVCRENPIFETNLDGKTSKYILAIEIIMTAKPLQDFFLKTSKKK